MTVIRKVSFQFAYRLMPLFHRRLIRKYDSNLPIKVAFVVFDKSVWKTDPLFTEMLESPNFHPVIIVVEPISVIGDFFESVRHFELKGYETEYVEKNEGMYGVLEVFKSTAPDVVFLSSHFQMSIPGLYKFILKNFLTCYVPYSVNVSRYKKDVDQYNTDLHNLLWRNYAPHSIALETFRRIQSIRGANVVVTGYPALEPLAKRDELNDVWKSCGRKRVIWAPHHTIDMPELPYATFLQYAEIFRKLAIRYSDRISWAFKPHPLLRGKLESHPDWGKAKTDKYYQFWEKQEYTQLELGGTDDLFKSSDAMIHDSGSFIAEYLYVDKPVMFLWSSPAISEFFNEYGKQALFANERGEDSEAIERFLEDLLENRDLGRMARASFLKRFPIDIRGSSPSENIMKDLIRQLKRK